MPNIMDRTESEDEFESFPGYFNRDEGPVAAPGCDAEGHPTTSAADNMAARTSSTLKKANVATEQGDDETQDPLSTTSDRWEGVELSEKEKRRRRRARSHLANGRGKVGLAGELE